MKQKLAKIGRRFTRLSGFIDITNQKFNFLTVIKLDHKNSKGIYIWLCKCDCGKLHLTKADALKSGKTKSCGCWQQYCRGKSTTKHGMAETKTFNIWMNMFTRCYNKNCKAYKNYGERGIIIDERWHIFLNFLEDMGECPSEYSIERLDVNKNYEPGNCKWIPFKSQARNTRKTFRVTYKGITKPLHIWAEEFGILQNTLYQRIKVYNWPIDDAFTRPSRISSRTRK